jgi:sodium/bile acid cotransporter 7
MRSILQRNWFLIGLALAVTVGILGHGQLDWLAQQKWLRSGTVFVVLFVMTLPLKAEAILRVVRQPFPALLASSINLGLIPPLAWLLSPLLPLPLARGLIVAAATPCTVASAAVWTRKAGGNDAVAIMVTVLTNVSCFAITPAWVWL